MKRNGKLVFYVYPPYPSALKSKLFLIILAFLCNCDLWCLHYILLGSVWLEFVKILDIVRIE